jgi:hypothetical protein
MKIIAIQPAYHSGQVEFAIVQLSEAELQRLLHGQPHKSSYVRAGQVVDICERFDHAMEIEAKAAQAKDLAKTMRAFAEVLETQHAAIDEVVTKDTEGEGL